jgi:glutaredoxin 3
MRELRTSGSVGAPGSNPRGDPIHLNDMIAAMTSYERSERPTLLGESNASSSSLGLHGTQLLGLAVDHNDPSASLLGIATQCFCERLADRHACRLLDARPDSLVSMAARGRPYCIRAKMLVKAKGVTFEEINVSSDHDTRDWLVKVTGRRTAPQIFINDEPIGGFDEMQALERPRARQEAAGEAWAVPSDPPSRDRVRRALDLRAPMSLPARS